MSLLLLAGVTGSRGQSPNLTVLHPFTASNNDGGSPYCELTQGADGALYGVTYSGGTNAQGTVFRINTDGGGFTILHNFGGNSDGLSVFDGVIQATDGFLYGTTYFGGTNGDGTIFKLNTNGSSYSVIHGFTNSPDGAYPSAGLVQGADGALYGTASMGGNQGSGIVFKINADGSQYNVLHSFTNSPDGNDPSGRLLQGSNGILYGTTYSGGTNLGGTVFQINTNGSNYVVLHNFSGASDGFSLGSGLLLGKDGWLYGTTIVGGTSGNGTVFKLNTSGTIFAALYSFTNSPDGNNSYARLTQANDGLLYGTTANGGNGNNGTIFRIDTNGGNYSIVHYFDVNDGSEPYAGMFTTGDGVFYGTTLLGGPTDVRFGTVFRLALPPALNLNFSGQSAPLLTLTGVPGEPCLLQVSTDLLHSTALANITLTNGTAQVLDPAWNNFPTRFYRGMVP